MRRKNILVLTYWSYSDALIQTYTLPYVRIIKSLQPDGKIYLFTLEKNFLSRKDEERKKITNDLASEGIILISRRYRPFGLMAMLQWIFTFLDLSILIFGKHITTIHCWATPAGAAGYILSLITNRSLVIDSYEPHAEAMTENGTWKKNGLPFRLLFWLEKKQTQRADYIISVTEGMRGYAQEKYDKVIEKFYVKPACVDLNLFSPLKRKDEDLLTSLNLRNKVICVYAGKLGGIYLDKEVFDFIRSAVKFWGASFRFLLLSNQERGVIDSWCSQAGVDPMIIIVQFVPHAEVPRYMGLADFAITPVKPVPTKRFCTPIKDGEYWALGLPVIIPDHISDDSDIIRENDIGFVLKSLDDEAYQEAFRWMETFLRKPAGENLNKVRKIAERYRNFEIAEAIYRQLYAS